MTNKMSIFIPRISLEHSSVAATLRECSWMLQFKDQSVTEIMLTIKRRSRGGHSFDKGGQGLSLTGVLMTCGSGSAIYHSKLQ